MQTGSFVPSEYSKIEAKMTPLRIGGLGIVALVAACQGRVDRPPDPFARKAIEAAVTRYVAASNRGDADALMQLYAEDAVLLPPDHEPIVGREAIRDFWRQGTDEGLEVTTLRVETDGRLGYLVGRYTLPATKDEPADSGKYVMCLARQRDGSWKLTADIWNSSSAEDDDSLPDFRAPRTVSRAAAPRSDAWIRAAAPTEAGTGASRASRPPA
jgi:uncharacterized protein (TIGR02246 family)